MSLRVGAMTVLAILGFGGRAAAFSISSGVTDKCHESITMTGYAMAQADFVYPEIDRIPSGAWEEVADFYLQGALVEPASRPEKFFLFSLLIGTRSPDTEGFSSSNLLALRSIHSNPVGQYDHCLREVDEDYLAGNLQAVTGCRGVIREQLEEAISLLVGPVAPQYSKRPITLPFYGKTDLLVWLPAWHIGRAIHAMQDSFTHTLRTEDMRRILHVMNFAEAIEGELKEERDGMAHSGATDMCDESNPERVQAAQEATSELLSAVALAIEDRLADREVRTDPIAQVIDDWVRHQEGSELGFDEGCTQDNDYCESPGLALARKKPTQSPLGCAAVPGTFPLEWAFMLAWLYWRRGRRAPSPCLRDSARG